jgi:hypothetical protein
MSFEEEMQAGFDALAGEAGTKAGLSFGGVGITGVLDTGDDDPLQAHLKLGGAPRRLQLAVARRELAKLDRVPKAGEAFKYRGGILSVKDVQDVDPTDPAVVFVVKYTAAG